MTHDPLDLAYAAGIVDGEGCIGIYGKVNTHMLIVKVGMCEPQAVDFLIEKFEALSNPYNNRFGPVYRAAFTGPKAYAFLCLIRPYLRVKRTQADVAIEFWEGKGNYKGYKIAPEELARRVDYELRLKALKPRSSRQVGALLRSG